MRCRLLGLLFVVEAAPLKCGKYKNPGRCKKHAGCMWSPREGADGVEAWSCVRAVAESVDCASLQDKKTCKGHGDACKWKKKKKGKKKKGKCKARAATTAEAVSPCGSFPTDDACYNVGGCRWDGAACVEDSFDEAAKERPNDPTLVDLGPTPTTTTAPPRENGFVGILPPP